MSRVIRDQALECQAQKHNLIPMKNHEGHFDRMKFCGWRILAGLLLLHILLSFFINGVLFREPVISSLRNFMEATGGWVHPTLVGNAIVIGLVVGVGMVGLCKWTAVDLRWIRSHFYRALAVLTLLILVWQSLLGVLAVLGNAQPVFNPAIDKIIHPGYLGSLFAQLLGNALYEETFFRVFLFSQLLVWGRRNWNERRAMLTAALLSQAFFALSHFPNRLFVKGLSELPNLLADQASLFLMGIVFLLLWLWLQNLMVVVAMHALLNKPFAIFGNTVNELQLVLVLLFFAIVLAGLKKSIRNQLALFCTGGKYMLTYPPPSPVHTPPTQTAPDR